MKTALALSAFDIVDVGDLDVVCRAADECDRVVARVLGDDTVLRLTGRPPIVPEAERLEIVRTLRHVAGADLFDRSEDLRAADPVEVYGRFDQFQPSLPVDRWIEPSGDSTGDVAITKPAVRAITREPPNLVVGYVPGAWDLFHIGHLNVLRRARENCDILVAGVVTDDALVQAKGHLPNLRLADRMAVVSALQIVDDVVVDRSTSKLDAWDRVRFDVLFKGDDWQGTPKGERLEGEMSSVGATVRYFPYTVHTSSTVLRRMLAAT